MKKFLVFSALLVTIFIFNISKVYAMTDTMIFFNYEDSSFESMYGSTLISKLDNLKSLLDSYNINNRNYVISVRNDYINVSLDMAYTNQLNNYCSDYYIMNIQPSVVSSTMYYLQGSLKKGYCSDNSQFSITDFSISMNDFMNDNTSTFLNNLQTALNRGYSSNASVTLIPQNSQWGYDSDWSNNLGYVENYYTQKPRNGNQYNYWVYYSTLPIYFSFLPVNNNNSKISDVCSQTLPSNYWVYVDFYSVENGNTSFMDCGDSFKSYVDVVNSQPSYDSKYSRENVGANMKSFDIYSRYDTIFNGQLTITSDNYTSANDITDFKYYGYKCINKTCYWEEVNNNTLIDNYAEVQLNNGYIARFRATFDTTGYDIIKISLVANISNFNIIYEDTNSSVAEYDLNFFGSKYSYNYVTTYGSVNGLIINSKSGSLNYEMYSRGMTEFVNINQYKFYPSTSEIKDKLYGGIGPVKMGDYYFKGTQPVTLGGSYQLYVFSSYEYDTIAIYAYYNSTDVYYYYSNSKDLTYTDNYNGNNITYNATTSDVYINSQITVLDFSDMQDITDYLLTFGETGSDYKSFWEELWYEIDSGLRLLILTIFTFNFIIGIYLLFKH